MPESPVVHDLSVVPNQGDRAGGHPGFDGGLQNRANRIHLGPFCRPVGVYLSR
jgi:hypothetical protein